ncbi:hypothetical protein ACHWQZ_G018156 [Mnemiopsis leidyi]
MADGSCILLIQPLHRQGSRTYSRYDSLTECLQAVIKVFEEHLKNVFKNDEKISYNVSQLMDFVQNLSDIVILIYNKEFRRYEPYGRKFVKSKIYGYLAYTATNKSGKSYYY